MTKARASQINLAATPYYHCVSRCVRRSYLCGYDAQSQKSYEHRRAWIETRLLALAKVFCIDICAYAIMSNHYHVVLHINANAAQSLTNIEVIERWLAFHQAPALIQRFYQSESLSHSERKACFRIIESWRERLMSVSWFMKLLNQYISTQANREDQCSGHFWEGRFKSQALLDEKALAAAMAYVDLNPVRAGITKQPKQANYTSIKKRVESLKQNKATPAGLFPFAGNPRQSMPDGIPFRLMDYLALVEWTCDQGQNANSLPRPHLLTQLNISRETWLSTCSHLGDGNVVGSLSSIQAALPTLGLKRMTGVMILSE